MEHSDVETTVNARLQELLGDSTKKSPVGNSGTSIRKHILVLSGGGSKGIAHLGAMKALEDIGVLQHMNTFAGTSAGALVVGLFVAGYTVEELWNAIYGLDISKYKSMSIINFVQQCGLDNGRLVEDLIRDMLVKKGHDGDITLAELHAVSKKRMYLTTVRINTMEPYYLSHETEPNLPVFKAIRMSMSIPWYFTPVKHDGNLYVDGSCRDHYPIRLFKDRLGEVIGVYLSNGAEHYSKISGIEEFSGRVLECFYKDLQIYQVQGFEQYTFLVTIDDVGLSKTDVSPDKKKDMFRAGYTLVMNEKHKVVP